MGLLYTIDTMPGVLKFTVKLPRRKFLHVAVAAAALTGLRRIASALDYPTRTVRVIVPFAPGGPLDVFGRLMTEKLSEHFGQQFYIENIGGAGGNIGTGRAAKAAADGYTILLTANNHIINPLLYESVPYDAFKDFEPVTLAVDCTVSQSVGAGANCRGACRPGARNSWQIQRRFRGSRNTIAPFGRAISAKA